MLMKFKKEYNLRTSDFDRYVNILPSSVLDIFQDIAGDHARLLGCDYKALTPRNLLWVIVKVRYTVVKAPSLHQKVHVTTWPLKPTSVVYRREYHITDEAGETLIIGTSDWVLIDSESRSLAAGAENIYPTNGEHITDKLFDRKAPKIPDVSAEAAGYNCTPTYTDLDMNGHVNNTKYASFVLDALEPGERDVIESFQVEYHKEVQPGVSLTIYTERRDGEVIAKGISPEGETMFACRLTMKE